jgi:SAM-dependent methyltransferase
MNRHLLSQLFCPYCGAALRLKRELAGSATRLQYGLIECRCFTFPVIEGIPLLSLAKGYGGAEETQQPYVPLQAAAVKFMQRDDLPGFKNWLARHLPLAARLLDPAPLSFFELSAQLADVLDAASTEYLVESGRFEVLGEPHALRARVQRLRRRFAARLQPVHFAASQLNSYYVARFFMPRTNALALQLARLPIQGRVLSLCCGHGVFENLLHARGAGAEVVSVDGQFLNLLITRRYAGPDGNYLCHDAQFPLPFEDASFEVVFSSTCVPELPTQRSFMREALRVSRPEGWTAFDALWGLSSGLRRINELRHYRYCQNLFEDVRDYVPLLQNAAGTRSVWVDLNSDPADYLRSSGWHPAGAALDERHREGLLNLLVAPATVAQANGVPTQCVDPDALSLSPVYDVESVADELRLRLRPLFSHHGVNRTARDFAGMPDAVVIRRSELRSVQRCLELFSQGTLALLPPDFGVPTPRVAELR